MSGIAVLGAGAFGTALAISLAQTGQMVWLWGRDPTAMREMQSQRENLSRLPGFGFPQTLMPVADLQEACQARIILIAVPTQVLPILLRDGAGGFEGRILVACCKGIDLSTGLGPAATIEAHVPSAAAALLSGPSFAVDIAKGLPTALTLAARGGDGLLELQTQLSTPTLRLYRSTDVTGVEIGGALKNVIAIACGITIGAGLGESARAALMTRGYAEMVRLATALGARAETLAGLSGFGDLALTCTSEKSRNFSYGLQLGREGQAMARATTEGVATAQAVVGLAQKAGVDMPISTMMAAVLGGKIRVDAAIDALLARPLTSE
jgi:glycerol-3-phosphate dehydrogenase (NAD(P)+)